MKPETHKSLNEAIRSDESISRGQRSVALAVLDGTFVEMMRKELVEPIPDAKVKTLPATSQETVDTGASNAKPDDVCNGVEHEGKQMTARVRTRPAPTRRSTTHHFEIHAKDGVVDGYVTVGLYRDGSPCEVFLVLAKTGEAIRGLARCWATCFSICLQHGALLESLTEKFKFCRFEPSGMTDSDSVHFAHSIVDYVCRWLEITFLGENEEGKTSQPVR